MRYTREELEKGVMVIDRSNEEDEYKAENKENQKEKSRKSEG